MQKEIKDKDYEMVSVPENSPSELSISEEALPYGGIQKKKYFDINSVKLSGALIALVVLALLATGSITAIISTPFATSTTPIDDIFKFQVYCPISYYSFLPNNGAGLEVRRLQANAYKFGDYEFVPSSVGADFRADRTYIVSIVSAYKANKPNEVQLRYCGLTRQWNGNCKQPSYTCSSPGPMFDFNVNEEVDVIWINLLDSQIFPNISNTCLDQSPTRDSFCTFPLKAFQTQTFLSPTNIAHQSAQHSRVSTSNWPTTTHVHGLQVRPTFDGNPLTWLSNNGTRGEGAMSLDESCYYANFDNEDFQSKKYLPPNLKFVNKAYDNIMKVHRYPNGQNPGNLWYHDHSMRLTRFNAASGLSGVYIIRDSKVEALLPTGEKERFIMKTRGNWSSQPFVHEPNAIYRYRILNNDAGQTTTIRFSYDGCTSTSSSIPFTIIGADSSLFNETMPGITSVTLGPAERIEILIKFDATKTNFFICQPSVPVVTPPPPPPPTPIPAATTTASKTPSIISQTAAPIQSDYTIGTFSVAPILTADTTAASISSIDAAAARAGSSPSLPKPKLLTDITKVQILGVPFTNFSSILDKDISRFRMRPLMFRAGNFMINGHLDFHKGASQDPQIGTVEDWFIINTINGAHPIHVHLINFQVIEQMSLRYLTNQNNSRRCSLYEMDFYLAAMKLSKDVKIINLISLLSPKGVFDYQIFCNFYTSTNFTLSDGKLYIWNDLYVAAIEVEMYKVNLENVYDAKTLISGINVNELIKTDQSYVKIVSTSSCPTNNTHKYVCKGSDNGKPWYRRWKDTALIEPLNVFRYRIRWTMSDYKKGGAYFHVPVDQLREFPGFVYHCHILAHEDNEMMRSIMLQVPDNYISSNKVSKCRQKTWDLKSACLNLQCQLEASLKAKPNVRRV